MAFVPSKHVVSKGRLCCTTLYSARNRFARFTDGVAFLYAESLLVCTMILSASCCLSVLSCLSFYSPFTFGASRILQACTAGTILSVQCHFILYGCAD